MTKSKKETFAEVKARWRLTLSKWDDVVRRDSKPLAEVFFNDPTGMEVFLDLFSRKASVMLGRLPSDISAYHLNYWQYKVALAMEADVMEWINQMVSGNMSREDAIAKFVELRVRLVNGHIPAVLHAVHTVDGDDEKALLYLAAYVASQFTFQTRQYEALKDADGQIPSAERREHDLSAEVAILSHTGPGPLGPVALAMMPSNVGRAIEQQLPKTPKGGFVSLQQNEEGEFEDTFENIPGDLGADAPLFAAEKNTEDKEFIARLQENARGRQRELMDLIQEWVTNGVDEDGENRKKPSSAEIGTALGIPADQARKHKERLVKKAEAILRDNEKKSA